MRSSPSAMPPCGGVPYSSASRKKPKRSLASSSRHAQRAEDLRLHILAMDTDGARAKLRAVQHDVVRQRAHRALVVGQPAGLDVVLVRRSEGMVRGIPGLGLLVPLVHGKVRDPDEFVIGFGACLARSARACRRTSAPAAAAARRRACRSTADRGSTSRACRASA